ncbi:MAG: hypothetical protein A2Y38_05600 [Spirochaetes bacterium GWB1_59_5]|nr:MAG: hypothetical protein A2Y38_05600 [Spirochaetes bacterium GWB1_59_5]
MFGVCRGRGRNIGCRLFQFILGGLLKILDGVTRNNLVGFVLAKLAEYPLAQAAPQAGVIHVIPFREFDYTLLGISERRIAQPLHGRRLRAQEADVAQVINTWHRVAGGVWRIK